MTPGGSVVLYTAFKNGGTVRSIAVGLETRNMEVRHQRPNNSVLFSVAVIVTVFSVFLSSLHREKMTSNISLNEDDIPGASLKG